MKLEEDDFINIGELSSHKVKEIVISNVLGCLMEAWRRLQLLLI